jgi:hypothetical protein
VGDGARARIQIDERGEHDYYLAPKTLTDAPLTNTVAGM